jgi:hypothetical protein
MAYRRATIGTKEPCSKRRMIACRFDDALFDKIYIYSKDKDISFSHAVRQLTSLALKKRGQINEH